MNKIGELIYKLRVKVQFKHRTSKLKAGIFVLCQYNIRLLTVLFFGLLLSEQLIQASFEILIYGETFYNNVDVFVYFIVGTLYFYYVYALGDFLLDLTRNKNYIVEEETEEQK